ncbi:MAG: hypothetical protein Kow0031_37310 [Anaerolineae bacterium]
MTLPKDTIVEDRYRIDELLARGGMGAIYKGYDTKLKTRVAIKENFFQTPESVRQFEQEALILARLRHAGLPRVTDHFGYHDRQYLVMDFIAGQDLWEMIKAQERPLEEHQALDYIIQVCDAVNYLHQRHPPIIHRDIKPQNIKITPDDQAVLVDFGIAKMAEGDDRTRTGARGVTPGFSPPEQYSTAGTTPVSDLYALGATLYAALTGQKPPDSVSLLAGNVNFKHPDQVNVRLSHAVSQAIVHAMQPRVADRPSSVASWQRDLEIIRHSHATVPLEQKQAEPPSAHSTILSVSGWLVDAAGRSHELTPGTLTLGRAKSCDIQLDDRLVSRQHATLEFDGRLCTVFDEGSANGTFINDQRIGDTGIPLRIGDRLRLGDTTFTFSKTAPQAGLAVPPAQVNEQVASAETDRVKAAKAGKEPTTEKLPAQTPAAFPMGAASLPLVQTQPEQPFPGGLKGGKSFWLGAGVVAIILIVIAGIFFQSGFSSSASDAVRQSSSASLPAGQPATASPTPTGAVTATPSPAPETLPASATPADSAPDPVILISAHLIRQSEIREGPDDIYALFDTLERGAELNVIGRNSKGTWWQIIHPNGPHNRGWVDADDVDPDDDIDLQTLPEVDVPLPTDTPTPTNTPTSTTTPTPPTPTKTPIATAAPIPTPTDTPVSERILVRGGSFEMGSNNWDGAGPAHTVSLDDFYIGRFEVTNAQYAEFLNAKGNQSEGGVSWLNADDHADVQVERVGGTWRAKTGFAAFPVVEVSWFGARAYCLWTDGRLPTEAEWERAARGTDGRTYPWGNNYTGVQANFCDVNCTGNHKNNNFNDDYARSAPVGSYTQGTSPYGAYEMAGNVWEWVNSEFRGYPYRADDGRESSGGGADRSMRGGSWNYIVDGLRTTYRGADKPTRRSSSIGFRCAWW